MMGQGAAPAGVPRKHALGRRRGPPGGTKTPARSSLTEALMPRKRGPAPEGERRDGAPKGAAPSKEGAH
jgi:hypothetical protein